MKKRSQKEIKDNILECIKYVDEKNFEEKEEALNKFLNLYNINNDDDQFNHSEISEELKESLLNGKN